MEEVFKYKPKFRIASLGYGVVVPLFLIVFPIVSPFSITLGGFTIVPYPWTILLFILAALGFFWSFYSKARQAIKLRGQDCTIVIREGIFSYRDLVKGKVENISFPLEDVCKVDYDEEEGELEIYVDGKSGKTESYSLDMRYFETQEAWDRFYGIMCSL